jgi:protocatechuate 3,4-dioxygenase beta subunit
MRRSFGGSVPKHDIGQCAKTKKCVPRMGRRVKCWLGVASMLLLFVAARATDRVTLAGRVTDESGKPIAHATVLVFSAGVRKGYSLFCPTCYRDCGKRALTNDDGTYKIASLSPDLVFTIVATGKGYLAVSQPGIDPLNGPAMDLRLTPEPVIADPLRRVLGQLVDVTGKPVRDALIEPDFATYIDDHSRMAILAPTEWINTFVTSDADGNFQLTAARPVQELTMRVTARGVAMTHFTVSPGETRKKLVLGEGASILGRLLFHGQPVANAEVRLVPHDTGLGRGFPVVRIGTGKDGTFLIANVPPKRIWLLQATMESLAARNLSIDAITVETKRDGELVKLGNIRMERGYTLKGRVVTDDQRTISPGMRVTLAADRTGDSQTTTLGSDGSFKFLGLRAGIYIVMPSLSDYRLKSDCSPVLCRSVEVSILGDVSNFLIAMEPTADGGRTVK